MPHILIIDDDRHQLTMFNAMLMPLQFDVSLYTSAEDALRDISDISPDIILLDLALPQMNGFEFTKQLRQIDEWAHVPIAAISAQYTSTSMMVESSNTIQFDLFLSKPISSHELREGVLNCLDF